MGFIAVLLCLDLLLVVTPGGGSAGFLRILLAVGAGVAVSVGVILGFVYHPLYAIGSLLALPIVIVYAVSGLLLPWNQLAFYMGQQVLEMLLAVPVLDNQLATIFLGGPVLSQQSLRMAFTYHYTIVGIGLLVIFAVLGRSLYNQTTTPPPAQE